ncbi:MAG: hypothetical protein ABIK96_08835 [bacterium]
MPGFDTLTIVCAVGFVFFGILYRRAPDRVWYLDEEGDGVSARSVCGYLALICLVILAAQLVRGLRN